MPETLKPLALRLGLIVLVVAAVYGSTLSHGFVWDDNFIIVNNPILENLSNIPRYFLTEDTIEESTGYYRPVTYISFALDRVLWGVNPVGYHLTNLILHIIAALLFYFVVKALFNGERLAFVAALIFALHPVAGETVNFLAGGRNTLLSACFALSSLLFHMKKKYIPALFCFTLAIFSKEFALLFPLVFLFHDWRLRRERIGFSCIPYLASIACYLALRSVAVQKANFLGAINLSDSATAPYLLARYALNMIFPFQLKLLYELDLGMLVGMACLAVVVVLLVAVYFLRKDDELFLATCWFFVFLLPVVNIIPLHTTTVMADRYAYFSLMGFTLFLAALVCRLNVRSIAITTAIICSIYSIIDWGRNSLWKNEATFFTRMTRDAPNRFAGFKNLGMVYYRKGDVSRAAQYLEIADTRPDITVKYLIGDTYIFWKENMADRAEKSLFRALQMDPYNPEPYLILMLLSEQKGNPEAARPYHEALRGLVGNIDAVLRERPADLCRLGERHMSNKLFADAEVVLWQALKIDPGFVPALIDMGSLKATQGDYAEAMNYLNRAVEIDPRNASAHYNLALVYRAQGRIADAENEMSRFRDADRSGRQSGGSAQH